MAPLIALFSKMCAQACGQLIPGITGVAWSFTSPHLMDRSAYIAVSGRHAYVTGAYDDGLTVLDFSDPSTPTVVGTIKDQWLDNCRDVKVAGDIAFVAGYGPDRLCGC